MIESSEIIVLWIRIKKPAFTSKIREIILLYTGSRQDCSALTMSKIILNE